MLKILVEGLGEVLALPILFKRAGKNINFDSIDMNGKSNIVRAEEGFEKTIFRQHELGIEKFIVLLDEDARFPPYRTFGEEVKGLNQRAKVISKKLSISVKIMWAKREYESWLVGGIKKGDQFCGLKEPINKGISGDTQSSPDDPKEWIKEKTIDNRYNTSTQVCFTKYFDIKLALKRNNSFKLFLKQL